MAIQITLEGKDPREVLEYIVDFTSDLQPGDTLHTVTSSIVFIQGPGDSAPGTMLNGNPTITGPFVSQFINGGISGNTYEWDVVAVTTNGETLLAACRLTVASV